MDGKLSAADLERCAKSLSQRRTALHAALLTRTLSEGTPDTGVFVEVHDSKDDAFAALTAAQSNTAQAHLHTESVAVETALERIRDGSYGRCTQCNGDIGRERLLAQPSAGRCMSCQERSEAALIARNTPATSAQTFKDATRRRR